MGYSGQKSIEFLRTGAWFASRVFVSTGFYRPDESEKCKNMLDKAISDGFIYGLPFGLSFQQPVGGAVVQSQDATRGIGSDFIS